MIPELDDIEAVFGKELPGSTLEEKAARSTRRFVRSQLQITFDNDRATGHRLTASEALETFGWDVLRRVAQEGSCPLVAAPSEPAQTLRKRREELGLTARQVARQAGLTEECVIQAETIGKVSRIFDLEKISQVMALDESVLGHFVGAHADNQLGVRLRESARAADAVGFTSTDVLALTEAAWVIAKYDWLASRNPSSPAKAKAFVPSSDYRYKAYERGYELAAKTRVLLDIRESDPILSLKRLAEDELGVPVVQQVLSDRFAGATLANGNSRGIVVNERGMNQNVWVRRMTLAHEIAHLLWDPDAKLERLRVDIYDDLDRPYRQNTDVVEMRANAFAISFLAPPSGVRKIVVDNSDPVEAVIKVSSFFGISVTAARYHMRNVCNLNVDLAAARFPPPSDDWVARENLAVDFFRPVSTPISRRGRFAALVIEALDAERISLDTAAMFLKSTPNEIKENRDVILQLTS